MDAPNYVQGQYTVAQRDAIFAKADKYPDAANGLQNQVPTIFPDGSIGWRHIPEGGDGTANANIAVIESTQYASRDYAVNDLLIYNGQLYRVSTPIAAGGTITPETNVVSTTVALWAPESFVPLVGKGINLLDNAYFIGGGAAGAFPVNQRYPQTQWNGAAHTIDRWRTWVPEQVTSVTASGFEIAVPANASDLGSVCQYFDTFPVPVGQPVTFSVLTADGDLVTETGNYNGTSFEMRKSASWGQIYAYDVGSGAYQKGVIIIVNKGVTKTFAAAKLELGSMQTLARQVNGAWVLNDPAPNYQQELAKCQRYLQIFRGGENALVLCAGFMNTGTECRFPVPLSVPMAPIQSIEAAGGFDVNVNGTWSINASSVSLLNQQDNCAYLRCTLSSAVTQFSLALVALATYDTLILSAE